MSDLPVLWHRAHRAFPVLYQEAMLIADDKISIPTFSTRIARRLRLAGEKANTIDGNKIIITDVAAILITRNKLNKERQNLAEFLTKNRLQLGYIIQLAEIPIWGCVQISSKSFPKEITSKE